MATEEAAIKAELQALAQQAQGRTGREHLLSPYRVEVIAALDAGVSAEKIGALMTKRLKTKVSKDSVWRFGVANGAKRKRASAKSGAIAGADGERTSRADAETVGNVTPIRPSRRPRRPEPPPSSPPPAPRAPQQHSDDHAAHRRANARI